MLLSESRPEFRESANLDFLRSVAVLLVFGTHYSIRAGGGTMWSIAWHVGQLGVLIFFVHTSLVLMWSLERASVEGDGLFAQFYVRRALRIYPLSVTFVIFAYFFDVRWLSPNLWQSLTLTQYIFPAGAPRFPPSVAPLWTLPIETEMYIALPLLFLLFRNRSARLVAATWGVSIVAAVLLPTFRAPFAIFSYLPCFLGGVMAWRLMRERPRAILPGWLWPLGIAMISLMWMRSTGRYLPMFTGAFGIFLGFAIPLFREIPWAKIRIASKLVARYSYGIYLSHFPIMVYVFADRGSNVRLLRMVPPMPVLKHGARLVEPILIIGLTAMASVALYHGIENPGIRLGRKIARRFSDHGALGKPTTLLNSWPLVVDASLPEQTEPRDANPSLLSRHA